MANEQRLRSYRDYDAYERQDDRDERREPVRGASGGDPLAELARIMGQDDSYASLLKSVARTRTEPTFEAAPSVAPSHEDHEPAAREAHEQHEPIDIPAMPLSRQPAAEAVDWDDLEAELESYARTGAGQHPRAAGAAAPAEPAYDAAFDEDEEVADGHSDGLGLRGSYQGDVASEIDALEQLLREHEAAPAAGQGTSAGNEHLYAAGAALAVGAAGAAAWQAGRSQGAAAREPAYDQQAYAQQAYAEPAAPEAGYAEADYGEAAQPRRRRAGMTAVLAVVGLSVLGGGGVYGYRALTGSAGLAGEPRTVRANPDPVRVPVQQAQDPKPVTDRVPGGERVVSREERPVTPREQAAQVQIPPQPRTIPLVPAPAAPQAQPPLGSVTDPGQPMVRNAQTATAPIAPRPAAPTAEAPATPGEEPRRVRTVAVGPDGALPPQALRPSTPAPAPAAAPAQQLSVVPSASPQLQPAASSPQPAPSLAAVETRTAPAPQPRPVVTQRIIPPGAAADANRQAQSVRPQAAPANAPLQIAPQRTASLAPVAPAAAAPAPAATQTTASAGGSFVQISSHQSESEARGAFAAAQRRYSILQGRQPNIRAAEIPGRGTWHRLRVGPFSRAEAQSFCERLKSSGGSCVIN